MAVKVTNAYSQISLSASEDAMLTDGVKLVLTVVVIVVDVAVDVVTQVSELVISTFTASLLESVVVEKVEEVEEVEILLMNH